MPDRAVVLGSDVTPQRAPRKVREIAARTGGGWACTIAQRLVAAC